MPWRIMVVDDEPDVRTIVSATLKSKYEVVEAFDGLDALEKLDRYEPDFVVIDVMMPLMNGFDACAAIRRHPKFRDIPVMFLTALGEKEAMLKGYKAGANLYLTKPFDPDRLVRNVEMFFEKSPPMVYDKHYTIEQIRDLEAEKPAGEHVIDDINAADTLFDFTIPKEAMEWRKKHRQARKPEELSDSAEPTAEELKALKNRWKIEAEGKKASTYGFKPKPRPKASKIQPDETPPPREMETALDEPAASDAAQDGFGFPEIQAPEPVQASGPRETSKPPINFEGIPRIVPAGKPSTEARDALLKETGFDLNIEPESAPVEDIPGALDLPDAPGEAAPAGNGRRARIMVIDDDLDIVELCKLTLSDQFDVVWATDGLTGIENLVSWEPDLLLLDIMIPKVSGFQILQSLRRNQTFRNLIVVMISAKSSQRDKDYAYRLGANSYVVKPFAPSSLHELVSKYTSRHSFSIREKSMDMQAIRPKLAPLPDETGSDIFHGEEEQKAHKGAGAKAGAAKPDDTAYEKLARELKSEEEAVIRQMEQNIKSQAEDKKSKKSKKGFPFFRKG